jgi:predicted dinucleotide-binding enzyme
MKFAILGTGRVGGALGPRLAQLGHDVVYGSRDPQREGLAELVQQTGSAAQLVTVADAARDADIVVFAMPYRGMTEALQTVGDLAGKIVIDVTNALVPDGDGMMKMAVAESAAEELQSAKPAANVVKAFNTVGFHVMANPAAAGGAVTVPLAGDNADAKRTVAELVEKMGFETIDVGPLKHCHALESMAILYLVPYLTGQRDQAFEFYFRKGASPKHSTGVRAAG